MIQMDKRKEFVYYSPCEEEGEERCTRVAVGATLDGNQMHFGISICDPKDNFCKVEGRNKAIGRSRTVKEFIDVPIGKDLRGNIITRREHRSVRKLTVNFEDGDKIIQIFLDNAQKLAEKHVRLYQNH